MKSIDEYLMRKDRIKIIEAIRKERIRNSKFRFLHMQLTRFSRAKFFEKGPYLKKYKKSRYY